MNFRPIILAAAISLTTLGVVPEAQAASNWRSFLIQRTCSYLRRGYTPHNSGYNAAQDTINSSYGSAFIVAFDSMPESQFKTMLARGLVSTCPEVL